MINNDLLKDIDDMTSAIIDDVRKSMSPPPVEEPEKPDQDDQGKKGDDENVLEKALSSMDRSLNAVLDLFKASASKKMEGPDLTKQTTIDFDVDIPAEFEAETDGAGAFVDREGVKKGGIDATPILKAIDFNMAIQNERINETNQMLQALLKMQVAGLEINKAITAQMAQGLSGDNRIVPQAGPWSNQFPSRPVNKNDVAKGGVRIDRTDYPKFMAMTNAVNKALRAGKIDSGTAAACHDQHFIRADVWPRIEPFMVE